MIDENDLTWKFPVIPLLLNLFISLFLLIGLLLFPLCALPLLFIVWGRFYSVHFIWNKKKMGAMLGLYGRMNPEDQRSSYLQKYSDPASAFANYIFGSFTDRLDDYRLFTLRPQQIEITGAAGFNPEPTKTIYPRENIVKVGIQDLKIYKQFLLHVKNPGTGKTDFFGITHSQMRNYDQFEQQMRSQYPEAFNR